MGQVARERALRRTKSTAETARGRDNGKKPAHPSVGSALPALLRRVAERAPPPLCVPDKRVDALRLRLHALRAEASSVEDQILQSETGQASWATGEMESSRSMGLDGSMVAGKDSAQRHYAAGDEELTPSQSYYRAGGSSASETDDISTVSAGAGAAAAAARAPVLFDLRLPARPRHDPLALLRMPPLSEKQLRRIALEIGLRPNVTGFMYLALGRFHTCGFRAVARSRCFPASALASAGKESFHAPFADGQELTIDGDACVRTAPAALATRALVSGALGHRVPQHLADRIVNDATTAPAAAVATVGVERFLDLLAAAFGVAHMVKYGLAAPASGSTASAGPADASSGVLPPLKVGKACEVRIRSRKRHRHQIYDVSASDEEMEWAGARRTPRCLRGGKQSATAEELKAELARTQLLMAQIRTSVRRNVQRWSSACAASTTQLSKSVSSAISAKERSNAAFLGAAGEGGALVALRRRYGTSAVLEALEAARKGVLRRNLEIWLEKTRLVRYEAAAKAMCKLCGAHALATGVALPLFRRIMHRRLSLWAAGTASARLREHTAAAVQMQRFGRGTAVRSRRRFERQNAAAIPIQKLARGFLARRKVSNRKRFLSEREAATVLVRAWRHHRQRKQGKRMLERQRRRRAVVEIQRCWRGRQGRHRFAAVHKQKAHHRSAAQIQAVWRGKRGRSVAKARRDEVRKHAAATSIQTAIRGNLSRKVASSERKKRETARLWRRCAKRVLQRVAAEKAKARAAEQRRAAIEIQRVGRGFLRRKQLRLQQQREGRLDDEAAAATDLQRVYRGHRGKKAVQAKRSEKLQKQALAAVSEVAAEAAAMDAEEVARAGRSTNELESSYVKPRFTKAEELRRRTSAKKVQRWYVAKRREWSGQGPGAKSPTSTAEEERGDAVRTTPEMDALRRAADASAAAAAAVAKKLASERAKGFRTAETVHAADGPTSTADRPQSTLAAYYRMKLVYRTAQEFAYGRDVRTLQAAARGYLSRRRAHAAATAESAAAARAAAAATCLQATWRGFAARNELDRRRVQAAETLVREAAARVVQRAVRAWLAERRRQWGRLALVLQKRRRAEAARAIQATWRGANVRRLGLGKPMKRQDPAIEERARRRRAAQTLQRAWRSCLARRELAHRRRKRAVAEEEFRLEMELRSHVAPAYMRAQDEAGALCLQCWWRGVKSVRRVAQIRRAKADREKEEAALVALTSAQVLQRVWRGHAARMAVAQRRTALLAEKMRKECCVECETHYAERLCHTCLDKYCVSCWARVHSKGRKRSHRWDNISRPADAIPLIDRFNGGIAPGIANNSWARQASHEGALGAYAGPPLPLLANANSANGYTGEAAGRGALALASNAGVDATALLPLLPSDGTIDRYYNEAAIISMGNSNSARGAWNAAAGAVQVSQASGATASTGMVAASSWQHVVDPRGNYYYDSATGESSWDPPPGWMQQVGHQAPGSVGALAAPQAVDGSVQSASYGYGYGSSSNSSAVAAGGSVLSVGFNSSSTEPEAVPWPYGYNDQGQKTLGDWVEYFDDSAQAFYWFNTSTGEASWTVPDP